MTGPLDRLTTWWWTKLGGQSAWRRLDPQLLEFEAVYGPVVDELDPDIIHANDFRMIGVGARAVMRAATRGRDVKLVWDAHEFLPGLERGSGHPRWRAAQLLHESEFVPHADAVVTVTEGLADALQATHSLSRRPTVVLNAPQQTDQTDHAVMDVRTQCGLVDGVPLFVYSGVAAPRRGLDVMIETLASMPGCHVAFVVPSPVNSYVEDLKKRARNMGVIDRVHVLPYVPVESIVPFLRTATVGVFPAHRNLNHDLALPTKLFEYVHARLPVLVSDVRDTAAAVRAHGIGEVFVAQDATDYGRAAARLLQDPEHYRRAIEQLGLLREWTWERQADRLDEVYEQVRSVGRRQRKV